MKILLFTTNTCGYCGPAKELLAKSNIPDIEYINASENLALAREYGIRSVPSLVVSKCSGNETFIGIDEIQSFIDKMSKEEDCGCGCDCGGH